MIFRQKVIRHMPQSRRNFGAHSKRSVLRDLEYIFDLEWNLSILNGKFREKMRLFQRDPEKKIEELQNLFPKDIQFHKTEQPYPFPRILILLRGASISETGAIKPI